MLTRQVSLVRTQYRAPVASLRKETQAISSAPMGVVAKKGKTAPVSRLRNRLR